MHTSSCVGDILLANTSLNEYHWIFHFHKSVKHVNSLKTNSEKKVFSNNVFGRWQINLWSVYTYQLRWPSKESGCK